SPPCSHPALPSFPTRRSSDLAGDVTRLRVGLPQVKRHALVGPLLRAVLAVDQRVIAFRRCSFGRHQRRPLHGAIVIAVGSSRRVLVESVERHALGVGKNLALGRLHRLDGASGIVIGIGKGNGGGHEGGGRQYVYTHDLSLSFWSCGPWPVCR